MSEVVILPPPPPETVHRTMASRLAEVDRRAFLQKAGIAGPPASFDAMMDAAAMEKIIALLRRFSVPVRCLGGILLDANAFLIKKSKNNLRARISLRSRFPKPLQPLGRVFGDSRSQRIGRR